MGYPCYHVGSFCVKNSFNGAHLSFVAGPTILSFLVFIQWKRSQMSDFTDSTSDEISL